MSYEELFRLIDIDGNGELSLSEFTAFCETIPNAPPTNVVARLFSKADVDQSGFIDIKEFGALCEGVKMLVKLSERELCDSYSTSELQRLFSYLATNGTSLRRDEVRKAADVVNEALSLKLSSDAVAVAIRDSGGNEWDFSAFRKLLSKIAPQHSLEQIVRAFKEEEIRRKERLTRVKSVFERNQQPAPSAVDGACVRCRNLQCDLDDLLAKSESQMNVIQQLQFALNERQELEARSEVSRQLRAKELERELEQKQSDLDSMNSDLRHLKEINTDREQKISSLEQQCAAFASSMQELEGVRCGSDALRDEVELLRRELQLAKSTNERQESELLQNVFDLNSCRKRVADLETELLRSSNLLEELAASKESDSQKLGSAIDEMKRRCQEREEAANAAIAHGDALKLRVQSMEKDISVREVSLAKKERDLRDERLSMQKKFDEQFARKQLQLEETEKALNAREMDVATLEAEIHVRQQLLEHNVRRAESVSLPERERRMRLLQGIEAELCLRERNLRVAEAQYISQLTSPELVRLRSENQRLRDTVEELRAARDAASTFMAAKHSGAAERTLERGILSPSFKLL